MELGFDFRCENVVCVIAESGYYFVMPVCRSVFQSAQNKSARTELIVIKYDIR
jgi:hypothetical protein